MLEGGVFASATPSIRVGNVRAARSRIARGTPVLLSTMRCNRLQVVADPGRWRTDRYVPRFRHPGNFREQWSRTLAPWLLP